MSEFNYSFELYTLSESITPYGVLETSPPDLETYVLNDFSDGTHFRTGPDSTGALQLHLDDRILTILLDQSGSLTWNDNTNERYTYLSRILSKLGATYPESISTNLLGFGGEIVETLIFVSKIDDQETNITSANFADFLKSSLESSVFDFAGVRIVRRTDGFPSHPADGSIVADGIFEAVKDTGLVSGTLYYYGIWAYNKNGHFSVGRFISGTPQEKILPSGVNSVLADSRILPGVRRDNHTELIYNFEDKSGLIVFDSSGNGLHGVLGSEVIESNFWSGDGVDGYSVSGGMEQSSGVRFDGTFDLIETVGSYRTAYVQSGSSHNHTLTISLWIYRNTQSSASWVIGTSTQDPTNDVGWAIGLDSNGTILFHFNGDISAGFNQNTGEVIPVRTWTMVTFVLPESGQSSQLYINGQASVWSMVMPAVDTSLYNVIYIGAKPVDSGSTWSGIDYSGALHLLSIHSTNRSADYILDLYEQEKLSFNRTIKDIAQNLIDNKQREVLLSWNIESGFDYENGYVKIIRKYNDIPENDSDGDVVCLITPEVGTLYYLDVYDFIHNSNYYYRIFTINSMGNCCDLRESRTISIYIQKSDNSDPDPELSTVSDTVITPGNSRIYLQWTNPTDSRYRGTKIWYSTKSFPKISTSSQNTVDISNGILLTDTTDSSIVHRIDGSSNVNAVIPLQNGVSYYYSIVTYDKYGRYSTPKYIIGIPSSDLDTSFIADDVKELYLSITSPTSLSLFWSNPTTKSEQLRLWMKEPAVVFAAIRNLYNE